MQADKTISHYHTDPKIIQQTGIGLFPPGTLVYLDIDGIYKKAIATSVISAHIHGMVWQIFGPDKISLKVEPTSVFYEYPLGPEYFLKTVDGKVDPLAVNPDLIPGANGCILYLSATVPGGIQDFRPDIWYVSIVGYKTTEGFVFRPERIMCCPWD